MCFMPIILISSLIFRKFSRANYRKVRKSFSVMNAFLNENIMGMKITQIFNQEDKKYNEFKKYKKIEKYALSNLHLKPLGHPSNGSQ